jgi:hypothetical protein
MKRWELGNRVVSVLLMLTIQMTANMLDESLHEVFGNLSVLSHKSLDACAVSPNPSFVPHASVNDNENNTASAAAPGSGISALERAKLVVAEMEQLGAVGGKLDLGRRTPGVLPCEW